MRRMVRAWWGVIAGLSLFALTACSPAAPVIVARAEGTHVSITASLNAAATAPGGAVTLILDVTPGPSMHVYAPGQEGYLPAAFTLTSPGDAHAAPAVYSPAHAQFFPSLNQTLQVYDAPFRLTTVVTMAASAHGAIAMRGQFEYQACDDNVCYRPDSVPLAWSVVVNSR